MSHDDETNHWYRPAYIDKKKSFEYYQRAAFLGYPPSECELG